MMSWAKIKFKYQLIGGLSLLLLVTVAIYTWHQNRTTEQQLRQSLAQISRQLRHAFQAELDTSENRMLQIATFVAGDSEVQRLFLLGKKAVELEGGGAGGELAAQVRASLYKQLQNSYRVLTERFDFRQLNFYFSPGALSFLRLNQPERFGDRADQTRPLVVAANTQKKPVTGFETDRFSSNLRGVNPVFALDSAADEEVHVGAVEAGTSFTNMLQRLQPNYPGLEAAILLARNHLHSSLGATAREKLVFNRNYSVAASTAPLIEDLLARYDLTTEFTATALQLLKLGEQSYSVTSFPLRDYRGEQNSSRPDAGRIVLWRNISADVAAIEAQRQNNYLDALLFFLGLETLLVFGVHFSTARLQTELERTRQREQVTEQAAALTQNQDFSQEPPEIHLQRALQLQLDSLVTVSEAEYGLLVSGEKEPGEYRFLAASKMRWSTDSGHQFYEEARRQMEEQGFFPCRLGDNFIAQTLTTGQPLHLDRQACHQHITPLLPAGHPRLDNLLMLPISAGEQKLGVLVLANHPTGFSAEEQRIARVYAGAAALIIRADEREIARLAAEQSVRLKDQFLRTMNHELRTPLNAIMGFGQLLGESPLNRQQQDYLDKINLSSRALLTLIEEIMIIAKRETKELQPSDAVVFSPRQLAEQVRLRFDDQARRKNIQLQLALPTSLPFQLKGHPDALLRLLQQLCGNAIKFSQSGTVVLALEPVVTTAQEITLEFSVTDQGIGIPEEKHDQIFEPFFQLDSTLSRGHEGAGLGLAIAAKLCRQLGGEIQLASVPGEGSRFSFQLAFEPVTETTEATDNELPGTELPAAAPAPAGSREQLEEYLRRLEQPLSQLMPHPCQQILKDLCAHSWPEGIRLEIAELRQRIDQYRFSAAEEKVKTLQQQLNNWS
jgi:signal transduction histidine kinase